MDNLLGTQGAAQICGVPVATMRYWRYMNAGPVSFKVGRSVRYRRVDLEAWLESQRLNTSRGDAA